MDAGMSCESYRKIAQWHVTRQMIPYRALQFESRM
jgi:hypothetical protein